MQLCDNTQNLVGILPAAPATLSGLVELTAQAGSILAANNDTAGEDEHGKRRSPEKIQADLEARYKADLEKLNARYAAKIAGATSRVKPVSERRKEALEKMDGLRAVVRRTSPVMDEAGIDALIQSAITKIYGDLADIAFVKSRDDA